MLKIVLLPCVRRLSIWSSTNRPLAVASAKKGREPR
jgi:hypothetical protein